jgi:hypothetical protein
MLGIITEASEASENPQKERSTELTKKIAAKFIPTRKCLPREIAHIKTNSSTHTKSEPSSSKCCVSSPTLAVAGSHLPPPLCRVNPGVQKPWIHGLKIVKARN